MTLPVETRLSIIHAESARQRTARAESIKEAWRTGQIPDAAAALLIDPDLAADRPLALDLAYEEFCTREEAGESPDPEEFCARFPFCTSLRRLLNIHQFLGDHPDVLSDVPPKWPALGDAVGDFIVMRELGRGGFSRVYLGAEITTGSRPVALKITSAGTHEAKTLGPLSHPYLIPVLSSPTIELWKVVAMPFVGTATLEDVISHAWASGQSKASRSGQTVLDAATSVVHVDDPPFTTCPPYPLEKGMRYEEAIAEIATSLFSGMAYLHAKGIAHRDLKPSNVLLGPTGHPYLLDFNLATSGTDPWRMAGTLPYMSPEQLVLLANPNATPPTDWRPADVFACGVVLFELLTGQHPFADLRKHGAGTSQEQLAKILLESQSLGHHSLSDLNPQVGRTLRKVVENCLASDPAKRPTAVELAEVLSNRPVRGRHWKRTSAVLLAVFVLFAVAAVFWLAQRKPVAETALPQRVSNLESASDRQELPVPSDLFEHGLWLYGKREYGMAASEFMEVGKERQDGKAYAFAAYCYSVKKEPLAAELAANEAIRLGYRIAAVYANRAHNRVQLNRYIEAKDDCNVAINLDPNLRAPRYTRSAIYLRIAIQEHTPLPTEAIEDIEWVTARMPNTPDIWMTAAQLYALASDEDAAMQEKAVNAVREAILAGKSLPAISRNPILISKLQNCQKFQEALKLTPGKESTFDDVRLVNPISIP